MKKQPWSISNMNLKKKIFCLTNYTLQQIRKIKLLNTKFNAIKTMWAIWTQPICRFNKKRGSNNEPPMRIVIFCVNNLFCQNIILINGKWLGITKIICDYNTYYQLCVFNVFVFLFAVRNKNNIIYEEVILKVPTF